MPTTAAVHRAGSQGQPAASRPRRPTPATLVPPQRASRRARRRRREPSARDHRRRRGTGDPASPPVARQPRPNASASASLLSAKSRTARALSRSIIWDSSRARGLRPRSQSSWQRRPSAIGFEPHLLASPTLRKSQSRPGRRPWQVGAFAPWRATGPTPKIDGRGGTRPLSDREEAEVSAMTATRVGESMPVTADGYEQLWLELETLRVEGRRQISERMREARDDGHLADNPALYDVLVEQAQLERRIATLEEQVAAAQIVAPARKGVAAIGTSVRVRDIAPRRGRRVRVGRGNRARGQRSRFGRRSYR